MSAAPWIEALLAWVHILAFLSWTVFLTSCTALARSEWLNAAAVARLGRVKRIALAGGVATLASGLLRVAFGAKGAAWYMGQPLLWAKLALVGWMLWQTWQAGREIAAWQRRLADGGGLPAAEAVDALRRQVMRAAHLMLWLPAAGVLLSRGLVVF